ncbi:MAG: hypothetical protein RJA20_2519 [Bacteroidota bacterium]|jgi:uncharacterized membrane protein YfcA
MSDTIFLFSLFFTVALVYSSVGFGGGSSYLAILALMGLPFGEVRLTAMACNIAVVLGNTSIFRRSDWWNGRKYLPFVAAGMPMAFLGAMIPMREKSFFILLGSALLLAAILLWFQPEVKEETKEIANKQNSPGDWITGGSIGLLSGMVGIGGGIFLSPLLFFLRWDKAKHIAATASLYILANSVAGLAGQAVSGISNFDPLRLFILLAAVTAGGQIGVRSSLRWLSPSWVRRVTALLVCWAGSEVLWKYLY